MHDIMFASAGRQTASWRHNVAHGVTSGSVSAECNCRDLHGEPSVPALMWSSMLLPLSFAPVSRQTAPRPSFARMGLLRRLRGTGEVRQDRIRAREENER